MINQYPQDMNAENTGLIIKEIRSAKNLTQKELASIINVEPKTISKWETGKGFPDISYIPLLSEVLKINPSELLEGKLEEKEKDSGNMKRTRFYLCPKCHNILTSSSSDTIFCCSKKLNALTEKDDKPECNIGIIDNEYFISADHPMSKENHLILIALIKDETVIIKRLYPEGSSDVYFPRLYRGNIILMDNRQNLYSYKIEDNKKEVYLS